MSKVQIIIDKSEYDELIEIRDKFIKAFEEKKIIVHHSSFFVGHSGFPNHRYEIINADDLSRYFDDRLNKVICKLNETEGELSKERERNKKKWWRF